MIELREITKDNFDDVVRLKVAKNQYTMWKFLIDEQYKNKGYGKKVL